MISGQFVVAVHLITESSDHYNYLIVGKSLDDFLSQLYEKNG